MKNLKFPVFKDSFPPPRASSMDAYLEFVLFVNKEFGTSRTREAFRQRRLPSVPFRLELASRERSAPRKE